MNANSEYWPFAVGYASSPARVGVATWARWRRELETYAAVKRLPLLGIFLDGEPGSLPGDDEPAGSPDGMGSGRFAAMLAFICSRQGQQATRVGVLLVPTVQHLALERDGTHDVRRHLLRLHFGLDVVEVLAEIARPGAVPPVADRVRRGNC